MRHTFPDGCTKTTGQLFGVSLVHSSTFDGGQIPILLMMGSAMTATWPRLCADVMAMSFVTVTPRPIHPRSTAACIVLLLKGHETCNDKSAQARCHLQNLKLTAVLLYSGVHRWRLTSMRSCLERASSAYRLTFSTVPDTAVRSIGARVHRPQLIQRPTTPHLLSRTARGTAATCESDARPNKSARLSTRWKLITALEGRVGEWNWGRL